MTLLHAAVVRDPCALDRFLAVILLGDLSHYTSARRRRNKLDRPL